MNKLIFLLLTLFFLASCTGGSDGELDSVVGTGSTTTVVTTSDSDSDSGSNGSSESVTITFVQISPASKTLYTSGTQTFTAVGGTEPYTYAVYAGVGTINSSTGVYTAPGSTGNATISVTDANGSVSYASVQITSTLSLSPSSAIVAVSGTQSFSASDGVPPYTYSVSGSGSINASTGLYTAPGSTGSATITVTDGASNTATASVTVVNSVSVSPSTVTLGFSDTSQTFTGSGGTAPYTYSISSGGGSVNSSTGAFTAPSSAQTVTVLVTDSTGLTGTATATIVQGPSISPSTVSVGLSENYTFTVSGGTAPYTYSVASGTGSIGAGTGVYTAPAITESSTIRVTDNNGLTSDSSVTVVRNALASINQEASCFTTFSDESTGTTKCFGINQYGQTGAEYSGRFWGGTGESSGDDLPAVNWSSDTFLHLEQGFGGPFNCAIFNASGTRKVKCWGTAAGYAYNANQVYGDGATEAISDLGYIDFGVGRTLNGTVAIDGVMSAGKDFTCFILDNDELKCVGEAQRGQLGQGNTNDLGITVATGLAGVDAIDLGTGRTATYISSGNEYTCAILDNGTVKCWGENANGQLGQGNTNDRGDGAGEMGDSLAVTDLGTNLTATSLITMTTSACVIVDDSTDVNDGKVKCWGANNFGQLAIGSTDTIGDGGGEMGDSLAYAELGTGRTATKIVAGNSHWCALLDNNDVKCFGRNNNGQVGQETTLSWGTGAGYIGDNCDPVELGTGFVAADIEAGTAGTCVISTTGVMKCFGQNSYGEALIGNTDDTTIGAQAGEMGDNLVAASVGTGRTVTKVFTSPYIQQTCVVLDDSSIKCGGLNTSGSLGVGNEYLGDTSSEIGANAVTTNFGTGLYATDLKLGYRHGCAILSDNSFKCWGYGAQGRLGYEASTNLGYNEGTMGDNLAALDMGVGRTVSDFDVGVHQTCVVLDNGDAKCWGENNQGGLGQGNSNDLGDGAGEAPADITAIDLGTNLSATKICTGHIFSCAVVDDSTDTHDGKVKCWGYNNYGQLGQGDTASRGDGGGEMGDSLAYTDLGTNLRATDVICGYEHACAIIDDVGGANTYDGYVKCWGRNADGRLGQGNSDHMGNGGGEMGDNLAFTGLGTGRTALQVEAAGSHTCILRDDYSVICYGASTQGQLGIGSVSNIGDSELEIGDYATAISFPTGKTVKSLADLNGSSDSACAIMTDNSIYCWGRNRYGVFANGNGNDVGIYSDDMGDNMIPTDLD